MEVEGEGGRGDGGGRGGVDGKRKKLRGRWEEKER